MIGGEPRVLLDGLAIGESPRWHDGRLWFSNWGTDEIVAVDLDGNSEVMGRGAEGLGWAVNWLRTAACSSRGASSSVLNRTDRASAMLT